MVQAKFFHDYQLKGNPVIETPIIGNLVYDKLGQDVLARFNDRFRGTPVADYHGYKKREPLRFSNIPRALGLNQILRQETKSRIRVLSPFEVVRYWDIFPKKPDTYADTDSVPVFPNESPNETLRKRVLNILGKDKIEIPLLVAGLGVEPADDKYGFTFIETPYIQAIEAPFLTKTQRVKYDPETKTLVPTGDDTGVYIIVPSNQSGLLRAYRCGSHGLNLMDNSLRTSSVSGRMQVIQDPQGRAGNLDEKVIEDIEREE